MTAITTWMARLRGYNPVFWQEANYFRRTANLWKRWELPCAAVLAAGTVLFTLYLMNSGITASSYRGSRGSVTLFTLLGVWIVHAVVAVRSIIAGVTVISREHVGQTWETLVLTGISRQQILAGKLFAALRTVMPWMLLLATLRAMMLPLLSYFYVQRFAQRCVTYAVSNSMSHGGSYSCGAIDWLPWAWLIAPALTIALTVIEVIACVSLGLAASAVTRRPISAAILAISARFIPIAIFIGFAIYEVGDSWFGRYLRFSPFTIADGGMAGLVQLINPLHYRTQGVHLNALPGITGISLLLSAIMIGSWLVSLWAIRRDGGLTNAQIEDSVSNTSYGVFRVS
ncbi:MAG: hypothetical protein U0528_08165 [Anaerolineae bacterium]